MKFAAVLCIALGLFGMAAAQRPAATAAAAPKLSPAAAAVSNITTCKALATALGFKVDGATVVRGPAPRVCACVHGR